MRRFHTPALRFLSAVLVAALLVLGCTDHGPVVPSPIAGGALTGTVTLLGSDGPAHPVAIGIALYASREDLEARRPAYRAALERVASPARAFAYSFPTVAPGDYYLMACFAFGCGEYREPDTGALLSVAIRTGGVTKLAFGL